MDRVFLKNSAKEQLRGKWELAIQVLFILTLFQGVNSALDVLNEFDLFKTNQYINSGVKIVVYLFEGVFQLGVCRFTLNLASDNESASFQDTFSGFRVYFKALALYLIILVCITIGVFLLVVPGIIVGLMFSQAFYILCEDNNKGIIECLEESSRMMSGYKFDYFVLELSFIGWYLIGIFTMGLANFILNPYLETTYANYYLELKRRRLTI